MLYILHKKPVAQQPKKVHCALQQWTGVADTKTGGRCLNSCLAHSSNTCKQMDNHAGIETTGTTVSHV